MKSNLILKSMLGVAIGWLFASNFQKVLEQYMPSVSPIYWVIIAVMLAYLGIVKLKS
jgi:uncharacterized protein YacL